MNNNQKRVGCLLFHGWTSSPEELHELASFLSSKQIRVVTPTLPGHGSQPQNLSKVNWNDWVAAAEQELHALQKEVDIVFVGGVSLGGNIALLLAHKHPVAGVISMGTPIFLNWGWAIRLGATLARICGISHWVVEKRYPKHVSREMLAQKNQYWEFPIKSASDALAAIDASKRVLQHIKTPSLIMQSSHDHLVKSKSAEYCFQTINTDKKKLFWDDQSYHVLILDRNKHAIFKEIHSFIETHSACT